MSAGRVGDWMEVGSAGVRPRGLLQSLFHVKHAAVFLGSRMIPRDWANGRSLCADLIGRLSGAEVGARLSSSKPGVAERAAIQRQCDVESAANLLTP